MESYIKLRQVSYAYPKGRFSLHDVSLNLNQGEITVVKGLNGSGKTTLGKIIMGILIPSTGTIEIDGVDSNKLKLCHRGSKIGYAFQNPDRQLFTASVFEEITFPLEIKGMPKKTAEQKAAMLLEKFGLAHLKQRVPMRLSRGEKQRLVLASILAQEPGYLILDEPSTGLDRDRRRELYDLLVTLTSEGIGMAIISHDLQFAENYANRIITMAEGQVIIDGL